jgi:MFS family permease
LINLDLFRIRSYSDGLILAICYFCGYAGLPLVLSLYLQEGLDYSPQLAGLTAGAFALGSAIAAPVAGRLLHRHGHHLLVVALGIFIVGIASLAVIATIAGTGQPGRGVGWLLVGPLLLAGLGGGAVITPNQALSLAEVDVGGGSTAGGTLQTSQRVGAALGTAITSAVFYAAVADGGGHDRGHYTHAFGLALWVCVALAVGAFAVAVRAGRRRRRTAASDPAASRH